MLILLAEDDLKIANLLVHLLKQEGYQVDYASDGTEAALFAQRATYDIAILDWMMPGQTGISVCRQMRENGFSGGILMLTAKDTLENKIEGLEAGADDYLVKPFAFEELSARLKALARRSSQKIKPQLEQIGDFMLDRTEKRIAFKTDDLLLSLKEYQLFSLLLDNNGHVVPREILIDKVWGVDGDISQNNLDAFIRLLRKKINANTNADVIRNVRGVGYKVEV